MFFRTDSLEKRNPQLNDRAAAGVFLLQHFKRNFLATSTRFRHQPPSNDQFHLTYLLFALFLVSVPLCRNFFTFNNLHQLRITQSITSNNYIHNQPRTAQQKTLEDFEIPQLLPISNRSLT